MALTDRVRRDERLWVVSLGGASFLFSAAGLVMYGLLQAMAASRYGAAGVVAILGCSSAALLAGAWTTARFLRRRRPTVQAAMIGTVSLAAAAVLAVLRFTVADDADARLFLGLGAAVFGAGMSVSFDRVKAAANEIFDYEQIQRLDPLFSSAQTLGVFVGGAFLALGSRIVTPEALFIGVPVLLAGGLACLLASSRRREFDAPTFPDATRPHFFLPRFRSASEKRFLMLLGAIVGLSAAFTGLFMYVFGAALVSRIAGEGAMNAFVGGYAAALTIVGTAFAVLAIGPLLRRRGLSDSLFIPPLAVALGALAMLSWPLFFVVIGTVFVRDVIVILQRTVFQAMLEGLPDERRSAVWTWLDGPVTTLGTLLGAGIAAGISWLVAPSGIDATVRTVALAVMLFLVVRFWLTERMKSAFQVFLTETLSESGFKSRLRAIASLAEMRHFKDRDLAPLIDLARDEREPPTLRVAALRTLGEIGDPSVMRAVERLIAHPDRSIRHETILMIARLPWSGAAPYRDGFSRHQLIKLMRISFSRETDREIINAIIDSLAALRDPELVPFLLAALENPSRQVRHGALRSMRLFRDPAVIDAVKPFLEGNDPALKAQAVAVIWPFAWERMAAADALAGMLGSAGDDDRAWGLYLVGALRLRDLLGETAKALSGPPRVRLSAAISLLKNGDERGMAVLEAALADGTDAEAADVERLTEHANVPERQRARIRTLVHHHHLHYPVSAPVAEPLRVRFHDIPAACLRDLLSFYATEAERKGRLKIEDALRMPGPAEAKGRTLLVGVHGAMADIVSVCLSANGWRVRIGAESDVPEKEERVICGPDVKRCPDGAIRIDVDAAASPSRLVVRLEGRSSGAMTVFNDREQAGGVLAEAVKERGTIADVVLALPRGGVVLGRAVADALKLPLDVLVLRRIGAPDDPEFTVGAVSETGDAVWNPEYRASLDAAWKAREVEKCRMEAKRRLELFRAGMPPRDLRGKSVLIVDDGIANGWTMQAAIMGARSAGAARVSVAVPVASKDALERIRGLADDWIVAYEPDFFWSLDAFYLDFTQVEDDEVVALLKG